MNERVGEGEKFPQKKNFSKKNSFETRNWKKTSPPSPDTQQEKKKLNFFSKQKKNKFNLNSIQKKTFQKNTWRNFFWRLKVMFCFVCGGDNGSDDVSKRRPKPKENHHHYSLQIKINDNDDDHH